MRGITRRRRGGNNSPQLFQRRPAQFEQFVRTICPRYLSVLRRVAPPLAVPNDRTVRKCSRSGVTSLHTQPHVTARTAAARVLGVTPDRGNCSRYRVERWNTYRTFGIVSNTPRGVAQHSNIRTNYSNILTGLFVRVAPRRAGRAGSLETGRAQIYNRGRAPRNRRRPPYSRTWIPWIPRSAVSTSTLRPETRRKRANRRHADNKKRPPAVTGGRFAPFPDARQEKVLLQ